MLALGVALIVGAAALHGALTGFHDWWFAIADYRLSVESVATGSVSERWSLFTDSLRTAGPVVAALAAWRFPACGSRCAGPRRCCALWLALSLTGFALGGLFHGHYYVGPLTPLCALAALALAAVPPRAALATSDWRSSCCRSTRPGRRTPRTARASARWRRAPDTRSSNDGAVGRDLQRPHHAGRPHLRAVRGCGPLPRLRAPLAVSVSAVPGRPAHPRRAPAAARHARRARGPALHRGLPAAADDRHERRADSVGRTLTRRYHRVATIEGVPIGRLGSDYSSNLSSFFMPCTGRPGSNEANSVMVGRSSLYGNDARVAADLLAALRDRDQIVGRGRDDYEVRAGHVLELLSAGRARPGVGADREPVAVVDVLAGVLGDLLVVPDDLFDREQHGAVIHVPEDSFASRLPCAPPII